MNTIEFTGLKIDQTNPNYVIVRFDRTPDQAELNVFLNKMRTTYGKDRMIDPKYDRGLIWFIAGLLIGSVIASGSFLLGTLLY